jgi:hypothetical protein
LIGEDRLLIRNDVFCLHKIFPVRSTQ